MSNIRVDVGYTIHDGSELKFRSPVSCSAITGLIVYYPGTDGNITSKVFALADAHGNNVGDIDHLFAENVVVKVILDVTTGMAFVQNADTNAYLEAQLASKRPNTWMPTSVDVGAAPAIEDATYAGCYYRMVGGEREWINPPMVLGEEYRTTERLDKLVVYTKMMDIGEMPHNSSKTIHNVVVYGSIFSVDGIVFNADGIPIVTFATNQSVSCDFSGRHVSVGTTYDFSNCTAYLIVKFYKM